MSDAQAAAETTRQRARAHAARAIAEAEVQTLDQQIKARQESLSATASDLRRLATDLSGHEESRDPEGAALAIAAMKDDGIEIVLPAESVSGS